MQAAQKVYIHRRNDSTGDMFGIWDWNNGNLYVGWYPDAEERIIVDNGNITYDDWNHIVFVWDNSTPMAELLTSKFIFTTAILPPSSLQS